MTRCRRQRCTVRHNSVTNRVLVFVALLIVWATNTIVILGNIFIFQWAAKIVSDVFLTFAAKISNL